MSDEPDEDIELDVDLQVKYSESFDAEYVITPYWNWFAEIFIRLFPGSQDILWDHCPAVTLPLYWLFAYTEILELGILFPAKS